MYLAERLAGQVGPSPASPGHPGGRRPGVRRRGDPGRALQGRRAIEEGEGTDEVPRQRGPAPPDQAGHRAAAGPAALLGRDRLVGEPGSFLLGLACWISAAVLIQLLETGVI